MLYKTQKGSNGMYKRLISFVLVICILLPILPQKTAQAAANEAWQYTITRDGTAQILGYNGSQMQALKIPDTLGGAWVTSIAEGAFAENTALQTLTIPGQILSIADNAVPSSVVIQGYTGSAALAYANRMGNPSRNLSKYDLFDDFIDLSDMKSSQWSLQNGAVTIRAPHAARVSEGSRVFLPPSSMYPQGLPVQLTQFTHTQSGIEACWTEIGFDESVERYHVEDMELNFLWNEFVPAEGVTMLMPRDSTWTGGVPPITLSVPLNKNDLVLRARVNFLDFSGSVDLDYEFGEIKSNTTSFESSTSITLALTKKGKEEPEYRDYNLSDFVAPDNIDKTLKIGYLPFQAGIFTGSVQFFARITASGELSITWSSTRIYEFKYTGRGSKADFDTKELKKSLDWQLNVDARGGLDIRINLGMGFAGVTFNNATMCINLLRVDIYLGVGFECICSEHFCTDINVFRFVQVEGLIGLVDIQNHDDSGKELADFRSSWGGKLFEKKWYWLKKHWEASTLKLQDECTYSDTCEVAILTGNPEDTRPSISIERGKTLAWIPDPKAREGFSFTGWYSDRECTELWDFLKPVTESMTLYAGWKKEPEPTPEPTPTATPRPTPSPTPGRTTPSPMYTPRPTPYWTPCQNTAYPIDAIPNEEDSEDYVTYRYYDYYGRFLGTDYEQINEDAFDGKCEYPMECTIEVSRKASAVTIKEPEVYVTKWIIPQSLQAIALPHDLYYLQTLNWADTSVHTVVLSYNTIDIPSWAFRDAHSVRYVLNTGNVQNIDFLAFERSGIVSISLPKIISIGSNAFSYCESLESIQLGSNLSELGEGAFSGCRRLKQINSLGRISTIDWGVFNGCASLNYINLSGIHSIGDFAFASCDSLESIDLSNISSVGAWAFYDCSSLRSLGNTSQILAVGEGAFFSCDALKSLDLSRVSSIDYGAFEDCRALETVNLSQVDRIGDAAFKNCVSLRSIGAIKERATIGDEAFYNCGALQKNSGELSLTSVTIGREAFYGCTSLRKITLTSDDCAASQDGDPFAACELQEAVCPYTSAYYPSAKKLTLTGGKGSTSSSVPVFSGSTKEVVFENNAFTELNLSFENSYIEKVTLPEGLTVVTDALFEDCQTLKTVILPSTVTSIGNRAFFNCISLSEIALPAGLKTIGAEAFQSSGLTSISIPNGTSEIGESAFAQCGLMQQVDLPQSLRVIGDSAFASCSALVQIQLPEEMDQIGRLAFDSCAALEKVTLPQKLKIIGNDAFNHLPKLESVVIHFTPDQADGTLFSSELETAYIDPKNPFVEHLKAYHPNLQLKKLSEQEDSSTFTITLNSMGGTRLPKQKLSEGALLNALPTPVWQDRKFDGWCYDWHRLEKVGPNDVMPNRNLTLYAKWIYKITAPVYIQNEMNYLGPIQYGDELLTIPTEQNGKTISGIEAECIPSGTKKVIIPAQIRDIKPGAFRDAADLEEIEVDPANPWYYAKDGVLYTTDGELVCYPTAKADESFSVPYGVTAVQSYAFAQCRNLEEITFPDSLLRMDGIAFDSCSALYTMTFASDPELHDTAIRRCLYLSLYGPKDAPNLDAYASSNDINYNAYAVSFESDGKVLAAVRIKVGTLLPEMEGPKNEERVLRGWSLSKNGELVDFSTAVMPANNITLYAVWGYDFSYEVVAGGVKLTAYLGDRSADSIRIPDNVDGMQVVAINNGIFDGMSPTIICNKGSAAHAYATENNLEVSLLRYMLTFETNGGSQFEPLELCCGDTINLPDTYRTGCILLGWYVDNALTIPYENTTMPAEDLTLYASWDATATEESNYAFTTSVGGITITNYTGKETNLHIPEMINNVPVVAIGEFAFADNNEICQVFVPQGVTNISRGAFLNMSVLESVVLPGSLEKLEDYAFADCGAMKSIAFAQDANTELTIGASAFANCCSIERIEIPKNACDIDFSAFVGCSALEYISVNDENMYYASTNSVVYTKDHSELLYCPEAYDTNAFELDYAEKIGPYAFNNAVFSAITITDDVTYIHSDAFLGSSISTLHTHKDSLAESFFRAYLPDVTILYIDAGMDLVAALKLPNALVALDKEAFAGTSIVTVECPQGLTAIGSRAFADCSELEWIILPSSVEEISADAFENCTNFIIYGDKGSFSEMYAKELGIKFRVY